MFLSVSFLYVCFSHADSSDVSERNTEKENGILKMKSDLLIHSGCFPPGRLPHGKGKRYIKNEK